MAVAIAHSLVFSLNGWSLVSLKVLRKLDTLIASNIYFINHLRIKYSISIIIVKSKLDSKNLHRVNHLDWLWERPAGYQLVGGVMAHQGYDG